MDPKKNTIIGRGIERILGKEKIAIIKATISKSTVSILLFFKKRKYSKTEFLGFTAFFPLLVISMLCRFKTYPQKKHFNFAPKRFVCSGHVELTKRYMILMVSNEVI